MANMSNRHNGVNRLASTISQIENIRVAWGVTTRTAEGDMRDFVLGVLLALGPSAAVVGWLFWSAFVSSSRDRQEEPWADS